MATINFKETVDNVTSTITKEDKENTDILELVVPFSTTVEVGDTVNYKDKDDVLLFSGIAQKRRTGGGDKVIVVYDHGVELLSRVVNTIYKNLTPEEIIEDVITTYTTLTYVSTVTSTTTITTYVANKKRAWDVVTEMAEILLANFRVDQNKNFQLELEGDTPSSKSLSNTNARLIGKWNEDTSQLINSVEVDGEDRQLFERTPELFDGTGSEATYDLAEIPVSFKLESPLGTVLDGFVEGSTSGDYTLDRENKQFTGTFASGSGNIRATYDTSVPINVRRRNKVSIDTYGQKDKVYKKPYIKTRDEATKQAEFILNRFSQPLLSCNWTLTSGTEFNDSNSYIPNNTITVSDSINNISGTFIIRKVIRESDGSLTINVGQPEEDIVFWEKETQQRVKQLEEKDDNSTILNEDELINETLQTDFDVELTDIITRTFDSDTFYLLEDGGATRNQMLDDGTGPVMRETGFSDSTVNPTSAQQTGVATNTFQGTAVDNIITELNNTITHMAVGDDDTTPTISDTTLGNETFRDALFDTTTATDTISFISFLDTTENNGDDIKEEGLFDDPTTGDMYQRGLTNLIEKTSSVETFIEVRLAILRDL